MSPPNSKPDRIQIAFGQSATTVTATATSRPSGNRRQRRWPGRYSRMLSADNPGVWRIQLVSLGDAAHEASHSASCTVNVTVAPLRLRRRPRSASARRLHRRPDVPTVSVQDASVNEGDSGTTDAVFHRLALRAQSPGGSGSTSRPRMGRPGGERLRGDERHAHLQPWARRASRSRSGSTGTRASSRTSSSRSSFEATRAPRSPRACGRDDPQRRQRRTASAAAPPLLPDLIVQSIDDLSPYIDPGACAVTFTVKNQGAGSAGPSTARVYTPTGISTVAIADVSTPALAPGQSVQESGVLNISCGSIGFLTVTADSTGAVSESDESNNTKQGAIREGGRKPSLSVSKPVRLAAGASGLDPACVPLSAPRENSPGLGSEGRRRRWSCAGG